ncbi:MAG: serine/threonine-protein kinase [Sphaerospermopsis sp. SIO1G1]|nr:serine/threonine-protein kinase [Sphaerospermopsis sp. SIO1G1]
MINKNVKYGDNNPDISRKFPDLSTIGYQLIQELGHNTEGGRTTYLANSLQYGKKVVIKQFCFARTTVDWYGVKSYQREIELLKTLNYHRIPGYLESFTNTDFFYLVQEYKDATSLNSKRCLHPQEIKQIAVSLLETLVYLQQLHNPIIHRDIKPENILVDENLQVYLVDFGLAKIQTKKSDLSTLVAGTPGFIPPEEQFGHPLTTASDLYSLGVTLICLLTNTHGRDISQLIDNNYRFNFQKLLPFISPSFRFWLEKMVEPNYRSRYSNAAEALTALKPIQVMGSGTIVEKLWVQLHQKKSIAILLLSMTGICLSLGTNFMVSQPDNPVNSNVQIKPQLADHLP